MGKLRLQRKMLEPKIQFIGHQFMDIPSIQLFRYSEQEIEEIRSEGSFDKIHDKIEDGNNAVIWINIHGIHDIEIIRKIADRFKLDKLIIQDIVDTTQRPKIEIHPDLIFFSVKSLLPDNGNSIEPEQISFILKDNVILSFQEKKGDHFEYIRDRLRESKGLVRKAGADYLLYLLLDAITDNYYTSLNGLEKRLNDLPRKIMESPKPEHIVTLEHVKQGLFTIRKAIYPVKEAIIFTVKGQTGQIPKETIPYFSDLKDQLLQLIDETDLNINRAEGITNLFFSYQGHRMNEVIKVLTIITSLFIPLTFIAGIYGMNFKRMPELNWEYGYPFALVLMLVLTVGMLWFFKRKKWL
ncbi:magnesium/cobalt transporter CorA [Thermophagus sp. OGC60D27]|uniref:magnesium/cobalt transporter CorA n=1 Tax=Thermophagus sp. OGC60D27 TaxID=3458415 RepID=UPI0040377897